MRARVLVFLGVLVAACSSDDTVSQDASVDQTSDQTTSGPPDAKANDSATTNDATVDASEDAPEDSSVSDAVADVIEEQPIADAAPDVIVKNDGGGCTQNAQCSSADYCAKADSDCNGIGSCMVKPQICPQFIKQVCGCNKKTYINYCYANQAGVNIAYNGACE